MEEEAPCPDAAELEALVGESLPDQRASALLAHIGTCRKCQAALENSHSTQTLRLDRVDTGIITLSEDDERQAFVQRMKSTRALEPATSEPSSTADLSFLAPSEKEGVIGTLGSLEALEVIGRGGMGLVLRAYDTELRRTVAVKVLSPALAASEAARERFIREARAAAAIHHENVLPIHAVDRSGELPYFTMPLIEGMSLQDRLDQQQTPMPPAQVANIASKIASGLAAAHAEGLIHRDIKPANILLDESENRVWLADFGLARALEEPSVTVAGTLVGTPQFMAPEQLDD